MLSRFEQVLDGSGYAPRDVQRIYFRHLEKMMPRHKIHVMSGPPGIGKSYIARTLQRSLPNTAIVTLNNALVDQYTESYPELNGVKGKDYYDDPDEFKRAWIEAGTRPSVFNPLSYYYYKLRNPGGFRPTTVVIDEAHGLADMLTLAIGKDFSCKYYGIPLDLDEAGFLAWLSERTDRLRSLMYMTRPSKKQAALIRKVESLFLLKDYLSQNLDTVKISYEERPDSRGRETWYLSVRPLVLPSGLLTTIFGRARLVLLSGTMTQFDIEELFPEQPVDFMEFEPLAPVENRVVTYRALPQELRKDYQAQAKVIEELYRRHAMCNTLVHVTYQDAPMLMKALKALDATLPILRHEKETKGEVLEEFKQKGGILLAAGMAEGVDLPGDLCRLIIIPRLLYPNMGDDAVRKRLAMKNGQTWYSVNTMMTTVQQIGRGVRGVDDWCHTYILDHTFARLVRKTSQYLTKGFKDGIKWAS